MAGKKREKRPMPPMPAPDPIEITRADLVAYYDGKNIDPKIIAMIEYKNAHTDKDYLALRDSVINPLAEKGAAKIAANPHDYIEGLGDQYYPGKDNIDSIVKKGAKNPTPQNQGKKSDRGNRR